MGLKWGFKDHPSPTDTWYWGHHGPHPALAGAALLPAGDVAPVLTRPRGAAALGPRVRAASPARRRETSELTRVSARGSAFYRLFRQLTSTNQSGASGAGRRKEPAGKQGKGESGGAVGAWGPPGHQGHVRLLG